MQGMNAEWTCRAPQAGGPRQIEWGESDNRMYMIGPAIRVFAGILQALNWCWSWRAL